VSHDLGRQGGRGQWSGSQGTGSPGGGSGIPSSALLTRDVNGRIEEVEIVGGATWTLSRNANQSVASLTDTVYLVSLDRDGSGILTGITATIV
jgi:hypothetical protein